MAINLTERISIGRPITREGISLFPVYVHDAAPDRLVRGGGTAVTVDGLLVQDVTAEQGSGVGGYGVMVDKAAHLDACGLELPAQRSE